MSSNKWKNFKGDEKFQTNKNRHMKCCFHVQFFMKEVHVIFTSISPLVIWPVYNVFLIPGWAGSRCGAGGSRVYSSPLRDQVWHVQAQQEDPEPAEAFSQGGGRRTLLPGHLQGPGPRPGQSLRPPPPPPPPPPSNPTLPQIKEVLNLILRIIALSAIFFLI